ncbi:MAG: hypothetical protein U5P41_04180 [Gammaproteobacteria bacterium]|nr:hypothetical protein [Gammaproteobacteria bacterium]
MQHLDAGAQIRHKQATLIRQLEQLGNVIPAAERMPMTAPVWGYRHKARLGVKTVAQERESTGRFS